MKRIGINLLPFKKKLTGTGIYAYNILNEIFKLDKKNEYFLFVNRNTRDVFNFQQENIHIKILPFDVANVLVRIFWEQIIFPCFLEKYKVNLLFTPSVVIPVISNCKHVTCIHDLIPFQITKKYSKIRSYYVKRMTKLSAQKADYVLTVSQNSKKDIKYYCRIPSKKIFITYNGISHSTGFVDSNDWLLFKKVKKIPNKYLLFLGTLEPGKNLEVLIKAYNILVHKYSIDFKLVLAGGKGWSYHTIFEEVKKNNLEDKIVFTDYVPMAYLAFLYKEATVFILPSSYEGFGIPALEAMSYGTPVVVSNTSSLPEVVGDAGKLVFPINEYSFSEAINEVICDLTLQKKMIAKGYQQAAKFSWNNSAKIVLEVFNKVV